MAQSEKLISGMEGPRTRVRTPGKYIVLFLLVPLALAAFGATFWIKAMARRSTITAVEIRETDEGGKSAYYALPEFLVDLTPDLNGRTAYLKTRISIALDPGKANKTATQIDAVRPAIVERLTFFLRELRPEDFQGSENMARVKGEILRRVNLVIAPNSADAIFVEELVIQ